MPDLTRRGAVWAAANDKGRRWQDKPKDVQEDEKVERWTVTANRTMLRRKKINITHRMGRSHARISGRRLSPPEIDTHVMLVQTDETGKWITKVLVPRSMVQGIRQEPIFPRNY